MELILVIAVALLCAVLGVVLFRQRAANPADLAQAIQTILQQINAQQQSQENQSGQLHTQVSETHKSIYQLQTKLAQLEEGNKRILDMSTGITELQNILQAPKLRGNQGEVWLETLLAQILPRQHFKMQYQFKTGDIVDAVILMPDSHIVPIDSKFSLENFRKMVGAKDTDEKKIHEKAFASDIKKRIDEIAKKYILPDEGTLNFCFMYVPAENVYYQAFVEDQQGSMLQRYAFDRHVIPVSPNSFYPYLEIVLFGLKGLQIEKGARDIQKQISGLEAEIERFRDVYDTVGKHLRHAQGSFDQADKKLTGIETKFSVIAEKENLVVLEPGE